MPKPGASAAKLLNAGAGKSRPPEARRSWPIQRGAKPSMACGDMLPLSGGWSLRKPCRTYPKVNRLNGCGGDEQVDYRSKPKEKEIPMKAKNHSNTSTVKSSKPVEAATQPAAMYRTQGFYYMGQTRVPVPSSLKKYCQRVATVPLLVVDPRNGALIGMACSSFPFGKKGDECVNITIHLLVPQTDAAHLDILWPLAPGDNKELLHTTFGQGMVFEDSWTMPLDRDRFVGKIKSVEPPAIKEAI